MEAHLLTSEVGETVTPLSRYQFQEPVLYDFIQSECEDFEEYAQFVSEPVEDSAEDLHDSFDEEEPPNGEEPDKPE